MGPTRILPGLARHFLLSVELNFRSKQTIIYGYLVPILFLVGFGSVFRAETPALLDQMGQILTITILGGACIGLPTTLVAERERGIWRRYRLLPVATSALVGDLLVARLLFVASAAALQIGLAHLAYHTPLPVHPAQTAAGVLGVTASFLGLGLLVAALADDVPAVQAMGQCLFLPMIMIGGVGIPLLALPTWAQQVAGFMPGRYAVEVLERGYSDDTGLARGGFAVLALAVIGAAAATAGVKLFRWEAGRRVRGSAWVWIGAALAAWRLVGVVAALTGRLTPGPLGAQDFEAVSESEMAAISYDGLPGDAEFVSRLAPPFRDAGQAEGVGDFAAKLAAWAPGQVAEAGRRVRNLLSVAAIADLREDPHEGEIARLVYIRLRADFGDARLAQLLAGIILGRQTGPVITSAPELGLKREYKEEFVRQRIDLYARKFLGRLRGRIRDD